MYRSVLIVGLTLSGVLGEFAAAQTSITNIVNPGFEIGTGGQAVGTGWTTLSGFGPMFVVDNSILPILESIDPNGAHSGSQFITGNRNAGGHPTNESMGVFQDVDLTPYAGEISLGDRSLQLSFAYNDADGADNGLVSYSFFNSGSAQIGSTYTFDTNSAPTGGGAWSTATLTGAVPSAAASMRISLQAIQGTGGTLRNVSYDSLSAQLVASPPPVGTVHGNLIQFDSDGSWTWYSDERAVVDPNNGHVLVNSVGFSPTVNGSPANVDVVNFDPVTGSRVRTQLSNLQPGNPSMQNDDHNNGSLLVLPDGRYLAMYSNHGNSGGLGDRWTRWRRSINPGDSTSWTAEQLFDWREEVPGADVASGTAPGNVSYHNLFYLSAEDQVYDISRSYGQLSTNGDTQNMPNIVRYDMETNSIEWAGQFLESAAQGYSAYPKYASNGVDRIYFTSTETHPRDFNNSVYSGYIQNGQTFDMLGNVIDNNLFDNGTVAGGSGFVPDVTDFTPVQTSDPLGAGYNRLWTVDLNLDAGGDPMALYISRLNPSGCGAGSGCDGGTTNSIDHRLHFGHWNSQTMQWETHEVAKMGNRLYRGTNMTEQDYTGNAALVPGDPSTIYISTPFDPRDSTGATFTTSYEIYKGVTADGGANWAWTAITENSVVDNLRPIIPDSHGGETTVLWFRGTYTTAQSINAAVVGIVDRAGEQLGLVNYLDANTSNTTRLNGTPIGATGPSSGAGANDGLWHQRTGVGNGGSVFSSKESGTENAPTLVTTIEGAADGLYDIFAYFWSDDDEDWRIMAGLDSDNLIDFRRYGSQHAGVEQFVSIDTVADIGNDAQLYRAYVGRTEVIGGSPIDVFIDDWSTSTGGAIRTWYDGVGYALVSAIAPILIGDYNGDFVVDAADYTVWRDHLGQEFDLPNRGPMNDGLISRDDYTSWKTNYGNFLPQEGGGSLATVPEPSAGLLVLVAAIGLLARRPTGAVARSEWHRLEMAE